MKLKKGLTPDKFTLKNIRQRLKKEGDLWKDIFNQRVDMGKTLKLMGEK
jgi:DNA primase